MLYFRAMPHFCTLLAAPAYTVGMPADTSPKGRIYPILRFAAYCLLAVAAVVVSARLWGRHPLSDVFFYPLIIVGAALAFAALLGRILRRWGGLRRFAFAWGLALSLALAVLGIDLGGTLYLAAERPSAAGVPHYVHLAAEAQDETLWALVARVERFLAVYNLPYEGQCTARRGFAPNGAQQVHTQGAYGRAQYKANGLLADGYVFSFEVATAILESYYTAADTLTGTLWAFNAAMGTRYSLDEALDEVRCASIGAQAADFFTREQLAAVADGLLQDVEDSTLLWLLVPLLEAQIDLRLTDPDALVEYLSSALSCRAIPDDARPAFDFYENIAPLRALTDEQSVAYHAFLEAAAAHDRALYEGGVHGKTVCSTLIGDRIGDGTYPAQAGVTSRAQTAELRWQATRLTPLLAVLCARNALLNLGGVAVLLMLLADLTLDRRSLAALVVLLVCTVGLGWGLRYGVSPAVSRLSYGIVDPTKLTADTSAVAYELATMEHRYVAFYLLSGQYDPALAYDVLSKDVEYPSTVEPEDSAYRELYDTVWQYYVLTDPRFALALTHAAREKRHARCRAVTMALLPAYRTLAAQGVRKNSALKAHFEASYRRAEKEGYVPIADSDALALVLSGRADVASILHLAFDDTGCTMGIMDVYGAPVALKLADLEEILTPFADWLQALDALSPLLAEDLALPETHRALLGLSHGKDLRLVLYVQDGALYAAAYPTRYLAGEVSYVEGTLVRYAPLIAATGYLLAFGNVWLQATPLLFVLFVNVGLRRRAKRLPLASGRV